MSAIVKSKSKKVSKYGLDFDAACSPLDIEFYCIQQGGRWKIRGRDFGEGLFHHYKAAMTLLWPEDDWHRWTDLIVKKLLEFDMIGIVGPGNSNKTYTVAKFGLLDYWVFPDDTLNLVSSTDMRGLQMRVWGATKELFNRGREQYPDLPGVVLESLHMITTDRIDEQDPNKPARNLKKGIICIPCMAGGRFIGLKNYVGIKQNRIRLYADEAQLMGPTFLEATANLSGNSKKAPFKAVIMGNPLDTLDPLGQACQPEDGWKSVGEPTKTTVWKTKWTNGVCVNLVGTDSPNFDHPQLPKKRYNYMIGQDDIDRLIHDWGKDSQKYYEQVIGIFKTGLLAKRILTRDMCVEHHALELAEWDTVDRVKLAALDAAYSGVGGDRCVYRTGEFGMGADGYTILRLDKPITVPVSINTVKSPEDQIAEWVYQQIKTDNVSIRNLFYDSTGRGTMGSAFARLFGHETPVPVEFGGRPSDRPVRHDLLVMEHGEKRHVKCSEHFYNFVSELWMEFRYAIECNQIRELDEPTMLEGCKREYGRSRSNKTIVESKHDPKARERMGQSPDLMDAAVTLLEGARQLGFQIHALAKDTVAENDAGDYVPEADQEYVDTLQSKMLTHA